MTKEYCMAFLNDEISSLMRDNGASMCGFADLSRVDGRPEGMPPRAVSLAVALDREIVSAILDGPTADYQAEYDRVNARLNELTALLADWLSERGYDVMAFPATVTDSVEDWRAELRFPFQHKTAARLAGLGWIGKSALFLNREYGSAFRLSTVATDAPIETGIALEKSLCGACTACVDACPSHAILGRLWDESMEREDYYDARACYQQTERYIDERGMRSNVCGICIAVCPWTRRYLERGTPGCR